MIGSWEFPRNPFGAFVTVQVAAQHGVTQRRALAGTGLRNADLTRSNTKIAAGQELAVIRNVTQALADRPGLGAEAGARLTLGMTGVWGFAMLNSPTPREAIDIAQRYGYGCLSFVFARPAVEMTRAGVRIVLETAELPGDLTNFLVERDLAAQVVLARQILGRTAPVEVETSTDPVRAQHLRRVLRSAAVTPGCGRNALFIPARVVDRHLPAADEWAARRWREECETLARRRARPNGRRQIRQRVHAAMLADLEHPPALEEVATSLHVSSRTLRRQLTESGTSFRRILEEVRSTLAEELLKDGYSVTDAAHRLGYSDLPSFSRAFKRWTGVPPSDFAPAAGASRPYSAAKAKMMATASNVATLAPPYGPRVSRMK